MISGVYYIKNKINNKIYIGSSKDIKYRKASHFSELRGGYHQNQYLQNSFNKYGEENFEFGIIEIVNEEDNLREVEQSYINLYFDNMNMCYNINPLASVPPTKERRCAIYTKDGVLYKCFDSIKDCSKYLGRELHTIVSSIKRENSLCCEKYMIRYIDNDIVKQKISPYKQNKRPIIELDENNKVVYRCNTLNDLVSYLTLNGEMINKNSLATSISKQYRYRGRLFLYEQDYPTYITEQTKRRNYKYILKFNLKGNLVEAIENGYGKTNKTLEDIFKYNDNIYHKNQNRKYRLHDGIIYIKSNEIVDFIKTNVTVYSVYDKEKHLIYESTNKTQLVEKMNITRGIFDYYSKHELLYNNTYYFIKHTY